MCMCKGVAGEYFRKKEPTEGSQTQDPETVSQTLKHCANVEAREGVVIKCDNILSANRHHQTLFDQMQETCACVCH